METQLSSKYDANVSHEVRPLISIVTACYNSVKFIDRLHMSLMAQSNQNFEWILVDDGSKDNTVQYIKSLSPPGKGMSLFKLNGNSGGGVAVGIGMERSSGDVLIIVDHDDELTSDALDNVVKDWVLVSGRNDVCGLFLRRQNPLSGRAIGGEITRGSEFSTSWQTNFKSDITDGVFALKREIALMFFNAAALESVCLFGVPLSMMTKKYPVVAGGSAPILIYHRDNPKSQTNTVRISRKTVYTYARYIDIADIYYLRSPLRWIRHVVALVKFSIAVYGTPTYHIRYINSGFVKCLALLLVPAGWLSYQYSRGSLSVVEYSPIDIESVEAVDIVVK